MKEIKINDNRIQKIIVTILSICLIIGIATWIVGKIIRNQVATTVVTTEASEDLVQNAQEVEWSLQEQENEPQENGSDISEAISENMKQALKEELQTKKVELEYETQYKNTTKLPKGMVKVLQQGQDGEQELIIRKQYEGDKLISDEQIDRKITKACINKIVEVGTSPYYDDYTIKKGDTVYSTPYTLALREKPKKNAQVLISIDKDSKLKVIKKEKSWFYLRYGSYYGWAEEDCITYISPNQTHYNNGKRKYTRQQLLAKLNENINVMQPSGLSLEQFKKILSNDKQDKRGVFKDNAKYFYYIEQQYGINGVFVAAIGIHESAWGTSKIARDKKNLFGYGAYDMSAYSSAYSYQGYAAGIDMIARVLVKNYLNPKGTSIYNGEIATGRYYYGKTIKSVNTKYATDKNWHKGVYRWMNYLYHRL